MGRGYQGRAELTAERFVPDEVSGRPGARLYRTGDVARWRADGNIEYLGRADFQVKLRGFRIELGEMETALTAHPEVGAAVVVAQPLVSGDKRLVAYVVGREGVALEAEGLKQHLKARLPEYMVPAFIVALPSLPLTPSGKVDRKALPRPEPRQEEQGYVAPRTAVEEQVAAIWGQVLGLERVGVNDNFFDLGGHSLMATRVASRVREGFGVELPLSRLFDAPTVGGLAQALSELVAWGESQPIARRSRGESARLSFAQQRLWFLERLEPGRVDYLVPLAFRLKGKLDEKALRWALNEVVARHEVLRTRYVEEASGPQQRIEPALELKLVVEDVGQLGAEERERRLRRASGRGGEEAVRLVSGPGGEGEAGEGRRGRARAAGNDAPHRVGRLVAGGVRAGVGRAVPGVPGRPAVAAGAAGSAVRGLRGMAGGAARGGGAGEGAGVLAQEARGAGAAGAADGQAEAGGEKRGRSDGELRVSQGAGARAARGGESAGRDAVHGDAGGVPGAAEPVHRTERHRGGDAHRGPGPGRRWSR